MYYVFLFYSLRILLSLHYQSPRTSLCHLIAECQTSTPFLFDLWSRRWCHLLRHSPWAIASAGALPKWVASASCVPLDSSSVVLAWHTIHPSGLTYILCNVKYWHTRGHYSIRSVNSTYTVKLRFFVKKESGTDFFKNFFWNCLCMYAGFV